MTVSIVIPCFNHAAFVRQAIESALAQDQPGVHVIVVNDGSTDRSDDAIAKAVAGHASVTVVTQPNRGLSAARNAGLAAARGDVVIFLDADDRLRPCAARAAVASLSRHADAMMTFGRCLLIDDAGKPMLTNLPVVERDFYSELLRRNYIWTPAMAAFRRDVFGIVGPFNPRVNPSADYDLYLRIARLLPMTTHDAIVAEYRQHDSNMSRNPVVMLDATLAVLDAQRRYVDANADLKRALREGRTAWRHFYGEHLVERFRSSLHAGAYRAAAHDAAALLRRYPRGVARHLRKKARLIVRSLRGLEGPRTA